MNVERYLARVGYHGGIEPTIEALRDLHRRHLLHVPFENLDIPLGRRIELDLERIYRKIVDEYRGGFCHELNGLFGWLLETLGYNVARLSARVFRDGVPGPEFAHQVLLVTLDREWLVDVGFGDSFLEPLPMLDGQPVGEDLRGFRLARRPDGIAMERRTPETGWTSRYVFTSGRRSYQDFAGMCHFQQSSPESHFTRGWLCSRATLTGRATVSNGRLTLTEGDARTVTEIEGPEACGSLLEKHTGVRLESGDLHRLWEARNG